MKIILYFGFIFFLFFSNNTFSKEKYTEKCDGFCEGEILEFLTKEYHMPIETMNKKKIGYSWVQARGVKKPNSTCLIFNSFVNRALPNEIVKGTVKEKDFNKYMEDFKKGTEIYSVSYSINSCRPCPIGMKPNKKDKTGYCTIPMIGLTVWYAKAWEIGFIPQGFVDIKQVGIGREKTFDPLANLPEANSQVVVEMIDIPISYKKDLEILRIKDKATGILIYGYRFYTYKTAAKVQEKSISEFRQLGEHQDDFELINFLSKYINDVQMDFSLVYDKNHPYFHDKSKLYDLIFDDNDLSKFEKKFNDVKIFHIQNRN
tara:strand:+ start:39 stop:986 length:948 start_codon:yes stop_codon:yes gene_type:complete